MSEKIIRIESFDPLEIFGINDQNLEEVRNFYPKLKIIARDNVVKAIGEKSILLDFEQKFTTLLLHYENFGRLTRADISYLLSTDNGDAPLQKTPPPLVAFQYHEAPHGSDCPVPFSIVKPLRTELTSSPFLKVTTLPKFGSDGFEPSIIVDATTLGSFGLTDRTVTAFPRKSIFSWYVPAATVTTSSSLASSIADWMLL